MTSKSSRLSGSAVRKEDVDAVLAASRVLVAVSAQSISSVDDAVDVAQFRALVVVASRGSVSLVELAEAGGFHMSKASRLCDRLVSKGLLDRADDPADRRLLILTLTPAGQRIVRTVTRRRRAAIEPILRRLPEQRRVELVSLLNDFAAAGGEPNESDLWALGWTT